MCLGSDARRSFAHTTHAGHPPEQSPAADGGRRSPQMLMKELACPSVGERCRRGIVVRPIMPSEGVTLTRIAVHCRVWFPGKCRLDLSLCRLGNELVLLGQMHQQRRIKAFDLAQRFLSGTTGIRR